MRTLIIPAVAALAALALGAGCSGETSNATGQAPSSSGGAGIGPSTADGPVLATVGEGAITSSDFSLAAGRLVGPGAEDLPMDQRQAVLDKLVTEEALWQEAAARGLYRDPKVRKIMVNLLLREEIYANVRASDFTEDELRAYYEAHSEEFLVPEKAQVKRIFIKSGDDRTAEEADALAADLRRQITADPARFKELAEAHSEDPYRRRGGDLGYLTAEGKPGIPPEVVEQAFLLPVGRLSDPFTAGGGTNLVMVANKREAVERTFEQMKGSVLRKLKNERYQEMTTAYVDDIKKRYPVDIDSEALGTVTIEKRTLPDPGGQAPDPEELLQQGLDRPRVGPGGVQGVRRPAVPKRGPPTPPAPK